MKFHRLFFFTRASLPILILFTPLSAHTLQSSFQRAVQRSEIVGSQNELLQQAEEKYYQALGAVLPSITATGTYSAQDPTGSSSIFPSSQTIAKGTITQPLFQGFREFAALHQANSTVEAQKFAREAAKLQLFSDVAQSYYSILQLQKDIDDLRVQSEAYDKRIAELKSRISIGRSRVSEVLSIESAEASLGSTLEQIKGQLRASRQVFYFLTGVPETESLEESLLLESSKSDRLETYLSHLEQRPDVKSASEKLKAAEAASRVASRARWPTLNATANVYPYRSGTPITAFWDAQLVLSVPLFQGGAIDARISEAESIARDSAYNFSRAKRLAEQDIRTQYSNVKMEEASLSKLDEAKTLSWKNYQEQTREYKLGLVTNLEVLASLTSYQDILRNWDRTRYNLSLNRLKLEISSGKIPK